MNFSRRRLLKTALSASAVVMAESSPIRLLAEADPGAPYKTPYKYRDLLLRGTGNAGDFDRLSVDDPIVFRENGHFYMLYIGFDGTGYQTGLASSDRCV